MAFPFAPLFSFLTNLLEIAIKLQHLTKFGRRNIAQCTSGIGNWMYIMSFVSYVAIPINVVILLVCRFPNVQVGASQDLNDLDPEEESVLTQYLQKKDEVFWTRTNIFVLAIVIEHAVIALKILIALIIPDVPARVVTEEFRRTKIEESVVKELLDIKYKGKHETFMDIQERLTRQAAEIIEQ